MFPSRGAFCQFFYSIYHLFYLYIIFSIYYRFIIFSLKPSSSHVDRLSRAKCNCRSLYPELYYTRYISAAAVESHCRSCISGATGRSSSKLGGRGAARVSRYQRRAAHPSSYVESISGGILINISRLVRRAPRTTRYSARLAKPGDERQYTRCPKDPSEACFYIGTKTSRSLPGRRKRR